MQSTIYKYPIELAQQQVDQLNRGLPAEIEIALPDGQDDLGSPLLHVVHVGIDGTNTPAMWIHINPTAPQRIRRFKVYGTGYVINDDGEYYVGTYDEGPYVWHVFDCGWKA